MYRTTKFISNNVCIFKIDPEDLDKAQFGTFLLEQFGHYKISSGIFDLSLFDILTSYEIKVVEKLVLMLKLNNIKSVVCGISPQCASTLTYFIDDVSQEHNFF